MTTRITKGHSGWNASTEYPLDHGMTLCIRTSKHKGGLVTSASAVTIKTEDGFTSTLSRIFRDYYKVISFAGGVRCTSKAVETYHEKALVFAEECIIEANQHEAAELAKSGA